MRLSNSLSLIHLAPFTFFNCTDKGHVLKSFLYDLVQEIALFLENLSHRGLD